MIATILSALAAGFNLAVKLIDLLHERGLVKQGQTDQQLEDLKGRIHATQEATSARETQRAANEHGGLSDDDGFRRD